MSNALENVIQAAIAYNNHQTQVLEFQKKNKLLIDAGAIKVGERLRGRLHDAIIKYQKD